MPRQQTQENLTDRIIDLVEHEAELFSDQHHNAYARIKVNGHYEIISCESDLFRNWIAYRMRKVERKAPASEAISSAINSLIATALFDGDQHVLYNRVAVHNRAFWYFLADRENRAVKVTPQGWDVVDDPPILFSRFDHQKPQVEPVKGGNIDKIHEFIAIDSDATRLLLNAYIVACFIEPIPHPIMLTHGSQGSDRVESIVRWCYRPEY